MKSNRTIRIILCLFIICTYPWRILAITEKDTDMPVNNLVYALASPNRIGDCSWIKTGKAAWDWWNDWGLRGFAMRIYENPEYDMRPTSVPASLGIHSFYKRYIDANGIAIVSSGNVRDEALMRARRVITQILSKRPDIKDYMVKKGCKVMIIGEKEEVCELPEYAHICNSPENIAYWNKRARGFGGAPEDEFSASFGEENVLGLPGDRYRGESIMVHEFAHIFHMVGIVGVEPGFNEKLEAMRRNVIDKGLWKNTYAISNKEEYFAETLQSFFNCNQYVNTPNGVHNAINTREKLKLYDPDMYQLLLRYLPEITLDLVDSQNH